MYKKILPFSACLLFTVLPLIRNYFGVFSTFIAVVINVGCLISIFKYYHKLPCDKQTILIFLMKTLTICLTVHIIHMFFTETIITLSTTGLFDLELIEIYTPSLCFMIPPKLSFLPVINCLIEILMFKILLVKLPVQYLYMNTKCVKIICITVMVIVVPVLIIPEVLIYGGVGGDASHNGVCQKAKILYTR